MQKPSDEHIEVAEKIRSGEYFREARGMYDITVHDPMVERYYYLFVSALAGFIFFVSIIAVHGLYPLKRSIPFIVNTTNIAEDYPHIHSLLSRKGEDPNAALLQFLVKNYVTLREEYNIDTFDRNANGIKSQSTESLFAEYQNQTSPTNPDSPIALYQRHSRRTVSVFSARQMSDGSMEVTYEATVIGKLDAKKSMWQANMTFNYTGIALDESTGKVKPFTFTVTGYKAKRLQDVR